MFVSLFTFTCKLNLKLDSFFSIFYLFIFVNVYFRIHIFIKLNSPECQDFLFRFKCVNKRRKQIKSDEKFEAFFRKPTSLVYQRFIFDFRAHDQGIIKGS